jgi:hypothetical protein
VIGGKKSLFPYEIAENKSNEIMWRCLQFEVLYGIKKNLTIQDAIQDAASDGPSRSGGR